MIGFHATNEKLAHHDRQYLDRSGMYAEIMIGEAWQCSVSERLRPYFLFQDHYNMHKVEFKCSQDLQCMPMRLRLAQAVLVRL